MKNSTLSNYLYSLMKNGESSPTEMQNFISDFIKYIFSYEKLDYNQYEINSHYIKNDDNYLAYMIADEKYINKYDMYFRKQDLKVQSIRELPYIIKFMTTIAHEVRHIIQYIKMPKRMGKENENKVELELILQSSKNHKAYKKITQYMNMYGLLSKIEKDADARGFEYVKNLLTDIFYHADDLSYKKFINKCLYWLEEVVYCRKKDYTFARKINEKAPKQFEAMLNNQNYDYLPTEIDLPPL